MVLFFVWPVFMPLIVILTVMIFLFGVPMLLTLLFLLFCAATSTRSLIVLLIVVVRVLLMFLVKVLQCCLACFRIVVLWIFGGFCILVFLHFLGVGPMGPLLLASTSSVARMCGCPMCLLQTFYLVHFLTIVLCLFLLSFLTLCPWAQGCGN